MRLLIGIVLLIFPLIAFCQAPVDVWIPDTSAEHGDTILVPVRTSDLTGLGICSAGMTITFDQSVIQADGATTEGTIAEQWGSPIYNVSPTGIKIGMAGFQPLSGSGTLIYIRFVVKGYGGDTTTIHFVDFMFEEGTPAANTHDGLFTIIPLGVTATRKNTSVCKLYQNYPNPFNAFTVISCQLSEEGERTAVSLKIYDLSGKVVRTLLDEPITNYELPITITWYGIDNNGRDVAPGVYFYKIKVAKFTDTKKMLIIK